MLDVANERRYPESSEDFDNVALSSAGDLARRAGLSPLEGMVLVGLFVDQLTMKELAYVLKQAESRVWDAWFRA